MDLYIIRHADALPLESQGISTDEERPLSEAGFQQARKLGQGFRARGMTPELIIASPLVRAQQTASEIVRALEITEDRLLTREELSPGSRVRKVARLLNSFNEQSVAIVGHQPDLGRYCAWLIGNKQVRITFAKGGAALIRTEGMIQKGCGELTWLITPEWVGQI